MNRKLLISGIVLILVLAAVPTALAANNNLGGTFVSCNTEGTEVTLEVEGGEQVTVALDDPTSFDCTTATAGDIVNVEGAVVEDATTFEHPVVARIAELTQDTSTPLTYDEVWAIFREGFSTEGVCTDDPNTDVDECAGVDQTCTDDPATPQDECFSYDGVVGLGRIMMAIRLEDQLENSDWTWEDLLAWQLDGNGWGSVMMADRLAGEFAEEGEGGLTFDEIMTYREEGGNWGDIHQATRLAEDGEHTAQELLDMRAECNWGQIRKDECDGTSEPTNLSQSQGQGANNPNRGGNNPNRGGNNPNRGPGNNNGGGGGQGGNPHN